MLNRLLCLLCCALLALTPVWALAEEGALFMVGYDGEESSHDWSTNQFFVRMQERTGIAFSFQQYTKRTEWQAAKDAMFQSGSLPDVLFKAALSTEELIRYTDSGQLIDLLPLLEENAPNLWKLFAQNPDWLKAITLPNGKVGALPAIERTAPQNAMWINQKWLTKLGLDMPTNLAELEAVLTAFRDQDPNENGKPDEIPLAFLGPWDLKFLSHAWGVVANDYNLYLDDAGQVHYWPAEDSFFDLARTLRSWYADGLLDPKGFTTADMLRRITDDKTAIPFGVMFSPTPVNLVPYSAAGDYVLLDPLVYEGRQVYRDLIGQLTRGTFAITSACSDPAAMLRWVDMLYTEEGAIEAMAGVENVNYEIDADGYWDWVGGQDGMSLDQLNVLTLYDTGAMPWCFPDAFYNRYADETVRNMNLEIVRLNEMVVKPFPESHVLTPEENQRVKELQSELGPYVDVSLARFVLGETDINDETIAAFRQGLSQCGMEDMIAFWQQIAQRP